MKSKLLESLAELEHDQWVEWSKSVSGEVSAERKRRWEKYWVPYSELSEEVKDQDRIYAKKTLRLLKDFFKPKKLSIEKLRVFMESKKDKR